MDVVTTSQKSFPFMCGHEPTDLKAVTIVRYSSKAEGVLHSICRACLSAKIFLVQPVVIKR